MTTRALMYLYVTAHRERAVKSLASHVNTCKTKCCLDCVQAYLQTYACPITAAVSNKDASKFPPTIHARKLRGGQFTVFVGSRSWKREELSSKIEGTQDSRFMDMMRPLPAAALTYANVQGRRGRCVKARRQFALELLHVIQVQQRLPLLLQRVPSHLSERREPDVCVQQGERRVTRGAEPNVKEKEHTRTRGVILCSTAVVVAVGGHHVSRHKDSPRPSCLV